MSTAEDLKATFSFTGAFESEEILEPYGNNALPLFAVGLHLEVRCLTRMNQNQNIFGTKKHPNMLRFNLPMII